MPIGYYQLRIGGTEGPRMRSAGRKTGKEDSNLEMRSGRKSRHLKKWTGSPHARTREDLTT